jgi:hypothetical protein
MLYHLDLILTHCWSPILFYWKWFPQVNLITRLHDWKVVYSFSYWNPIFWLLKPLIWILCSHFRKYIVFLYKFRWYWFNNWLFSIYFIFILFKHMMHISLSILFLIFTIWILCFRWHFAVKIHAKWLNIVSKVYKLILLLIIVVFH